jgi:hypothetical protein
MKRKVRKYNIKVKLKDMLINWEHKQMIINQIGNSVEIGGEKLVEKRIMNENFFILFKEDSVYILYDLLVIVDDREIINIY